LTHGFGGFLSLVLNLWPLVVRRSRCLAVRGG
jgi:hypothetical protein